MLDWRVDLHLHTTASDGCWRPGQLIEAVERIGIELFAVTDHDSLGSLAETVERVRGSGLHFLPGVEFSARLEGQLYHVLIYGFDPHQADFAALVADNGARLAAASDEAVRLLGEAGYPLDLDDYAAYAWDRSRGGWKALNYLIDRGICQSAAGYFQLFVEYDHPQPDFPPPEEVIAAARRAGGIAVLAHPGALFYNGIDAHVLDDLVERGIAGLECYSYHHDEAQTRAFLEYCRRRDLLITGGSDCHGGFVGRPLGLPRVFARDLRLGGLLDMVIS